MNRDDIIRMAREAGFNVEQGYLLRITGIDEDLERFAALVAAAEREAIIDLVAIVAAAEREAIIDLVAMYGGTVDLEAAIRARGNT